MAALLALIPLLPLASACALLLLGRRLPRRLVGALGVGSVGLAALLLALLAALWLPSQQPLPVQLWRWLAVAGLEADIALRLDGLALVWLCVITGVGFLIHLYSLEFMAQDADYARYFAYLNLFVAAMLLLVLGDNLLLLFLGWEGVGLCSYLLIGFWYRDAANGAAARKAFVVTRIGDAAMALGLFLLLSELGTLDIQPLVAAAAARWPAGSAMPVLACALLLGGALGKSAQLPLQTWLPDAMAGPTPVSALIHAATMVTAGVYLIARLHGLFLLAPQVLTAVAVLGLLTALMAAFAALAQNDIKRILAYSTISQLGYMFLALGVQAWEAGVFHMMTHAFFKALLFLAAGAVIHCLHHEHDITRMGGLRTRLPAAFWSFVIGAAALAALPATAGFASKDLILLRVWAAPGVGPWLWGGALLGALVTALYSFRLVFTVFFGPAQTEPDRRPGWRMVLPLALLGALALAGGHIALPLQGVFPAAGPNTPHPAWVAVLTAAVPITGAALAYGLFLGRQLSVEAAARSAPGRALGALWRSGWEMDRAYGALCATPYRRLAHWWRNEPVDRLLDALVLGVRGLNGALAATQSGRLGRYVVSVAAGLILLLLVLLVETA